MKRYAFIVLLSGAAVAIVGLAVVVYLQLSKALYGVNTFVDSYILVLSSKDEVFIFVGHGTSLMKGKRGSLYLDRLTYTAQFPEDEREDLLVARIKGSTTAVLDMQGFGYSGSPFVAHGNVYWGRGQARGDVGPSRWKWDGAKFSALSDIQAKELNEQVADFDASTKAEGWSLASVRIGGVSSQSVFHLSAGDVAVVGEEFTDPDSSARLRVVVSRPGLAQDKKALIEVPVGYQETTKTNYLRLRESLHITQTTVLSP